MRERKPVRTVLDVVDDLLWPQKGIVVDPEEDRRHMALAEVLCCLPEGDYQALCERWESFQWFIPHYRQHGLGYPFPATVHPEPDPETGIQEAPYAHVVYLSPVLENRAWAFVLALVAHETAHLVLGHALWAEDVEVYDAQENEAWELVRKWGFEAEAREFQRYSRWRDSWEEAMIRKLKEEAGWE